MGNEEIAKFIAAYRMYEDWAPEPSKRKRTRGNGEGSIRKRGDNTFEGRYTIGFVNGKQVVRSVYAKTRKECNEKMQAAIKEARECNVVLESKSPTLREWLLVWLNEYRKDLGGATRSRYISFLDKMTIDLRETKIAELIPLSLQQYVNSFSSYEVARRAISFLKSALADAMSNGYINKNPAAALRNPLTPSAHKFEDSKKALTYEEESAFVEAIKNNPYRILYQICLYAGLRRGEAAALTWENVDMENRQITVKEAAKRGEGSGYSIGTTKTASSIRTVPISSPLYDTLATTNRNSKFVCPNSKGAVLNADLLSMDFGEIMKQLNQKHTFHHLRHTFATRCIVDKGINPKVVQAWLGHSKIDMTMNTYTHATADLLTEEAKKLL